MSTWTEEDDKLATLAKGARGRVSANTGAALRDTTGRTYSSAEVSLEHFSGSAVVLVVAQAKSSGAVGVESVVVCADSDEVISDNDLDVIGDLGGTGIPVTVVKPNGDHIMVFFS